MYIIANPTSRKGKAEKLAKTITDALDKLNIEHRLQFTTKPEEATALAKAAADAGERMVLCIGGDGTVSEVVGGLLGSDTALGIIPAGTGDDFARYLGIPTDPLEALSCALGEHSRIVDAALANDRAFINSAGSGFDVQVLIRTLHYKKMFHGLLAYILGIFASIFGYKGLRATIKHSGGEIEANILLLNVANGQYIGGGMHAQPQADVNDGLFDVIYVDAISMFKIPFVLAGFIKGKHLDWSIVHHFRTDELTITTSDGSLQLDGEIFTEHTVHYKIVPSAIRVKVLAGTVGAVREKQLEATSV